jgi:transcriptional regulator with XRE-family HTH domain
VEKGTQPLGEVMREARIRRGFGQEESARRIGVSVRQYGNWERGKHTPGGAFLRPIAEALDLPYDELAAAANNHETPIDVQAKEARRAADAAADEVSDLRSQVEALASEVERLQRLARTYTGPTEEQLRAVVDMAVAARLAELEATTATPVQPDAVRPGRERPTA